MGMQVNDRASEERAVAVQEARGDLAAEVWAATGEAREIMPSPQMAVARVAELRAEMEALRLRAEGAEADRDAARETARAVGGALGAARKDFHAWERAYYDETARAEKAEAERDALRAIIDGRTVPPTAAEIEAHHAAGGAWFVRAPWRPGVWITEVAWREVRDVWSEGAVCIALDAQRKPCAWPVVMEVGQ